MPSSEPTPPARRRRSPASRLLLACVLVLAGGLAAEFAVRSYDLLTGHGFAAGRRTRPKRPPIPFRQFGEELYTEHFGERFIVSCHGEEFPFRKPEGTLRIVAFGGSTTHNVEAWEAARTHYPLELQRRLRQRLGREDVEVINVGYSAYSTAHSLIVLALHVLSWEPDVVLLSHNVNDRSAAYFPDFVPDYVHKYGHPTFLGEQAEDVGVLDALLRRSEAWAFARNLAKRWSRTPPVYGPYPDHPPEEALLTFERNLRSFVRLAREAGVDVVLGTQPMHGDPARFEAHMQHKAYNDLVVYPEPAQDRKHHAAYNAVLVRVAEEEGVGLADNAARMDDEDAYFTDHVHYTPEGIRVLTEGWFDALTARLGVLR